MNYFTNCLVLSKIFNFENNKSRKEDVLWAMHNYGWLTDEEYEEAIAQELVLKSGVAAEDRLVSCDNEECGYRGAVKTYVTEDEKTYYCPVCGQVTALQKDNSKNVYSYFADTVLEDVARARVISAATILSQAAAI